MATPVGHSLMGLAGFLVARHRVTARPGVQISFLITCVMLANLPDADFLLGVLAGDHALYHRTFTHSIAFAVAVGLICGLVAGLKRRAFWLVTAGCGALVFSHVVLDLLTVDTRPPAGVALWWPLSDTFHIAAFTPFKGVDHGSMASLLSFGTLSAALWDVVWMTPVVLAGYACSRYANR